MKDKIVLEGFIGIVPADSKDVSGYVVELADSPGPTTLIPRGRNLGELLIEGMFKSEPDGRTHYGIKARARITVEVIKA